MSTDFGNQVDPYEILRRAGIDPIDHLVEGEYIFEPETRIMGMPCETFYARCCGKKYQDSLGTNPENGYWDYYRHCQENH